MVEETPPKKRGRPPKSAAAASQPPKKSVAYTPELGHEICARIATGDLSLARLSKEPGMPALRTLFVWLNEREEFAKQMTEARRLRADRHRDKIEDIVEQAVAGSIDPQSARVSIE